MEEMAADRDDPHYYLSWLRWLGWGRRQKSQTNERHFYLKNFKFQNGAVSLENSMNTLEAVPSVFVEINGNVFTFYEKQVTNADWWTDHWPAPGVVVDPWFVYENCLRVNGLFLPNENGLFSLAAISETKAQLILRVVWIIVIKFNSIQ